MTIEYVYTPIYGVDPYKDVAGVGDAQYGGGAQITNNNLLISLWTVVGDSSPFPTSGALLRPAYDDPPFFAYQDPIYVSQGTKNGVTKGLSPFFDSRTSFKFQLDRTNNDGYAFDYPLLAILNPPAELKNHYAQLFKNVALGTRTLGNSVLDAQVWKAAFYNGFSSSSGDATPSTVRSDGVLPLAATSGANGVYPQFFDFFTMSNTDYVQYEKTITSGDFYVGVLFTPEAGDSATIEFSWPHSAARG